jgi:hypothetical protein
MESQGSETNKLKISNLAKMVCSMLELGNQKFKEMIADQHNQIPFRAISRNSEWKKQVYRLFNSLSI